MVLLHLSLEDAPHVLNRVQVWRHTWPLHHLQLHQQGSCHLGGVFGVVVMLENSFLREGIIFCFRMSQYMLESMFPLNELQLPSSSHAAPDHDATTTMLDCRQGTIFLVHLTRASPHMLDTIWAKQVYLRLIRPQDMVPVIHALGQVVFSKLFAGFFVSQLQKRLPSGTTAMQTDLLQCVAYGLSTDKLTFHFCNLYSNAGSTHASVFWSQLLHLTHSTRTQLLWSTLARPVPSETRLGKHLYDPGHCTVTQFQAVTELLIASAIFVESNNSISQILRELFAMRCHVEHPVVSMRELYSKNQIWTALKQDTRICLVVKQTKTWTWWIGHVALHG